MGGIGRYVGLPELLLAVPLASAVAVAVLYLLTLRKALSLCAPESRTLSPGRVWLLLLPLFNLMWHFVVVVNVARSFRNEYQRRHIAKVPPAALALGLAMCSLSVLAFAPATGDLASVGALICWIAYWVMIARGSRLLTSTGA